MGDNRVWSMAEPHIAVPETKREELNRYARMAGLYVRTYSPGDGVTRYRFFRLAPDGSELSVVDSRNGTLLNQSNDYFGPECLRRHPELKPYARVQA